ncbi:hypothetical protein [Streptomyces sp. NPDC002573]|uniref:hypothetical protein n=1 Tax=Streptomyces sp. NPDC002573 TaxID=3364651 RepID=UPI0036A4576F
MAKLGYEAIAIARGGDREKLARDLGAHHYIDSTAQASGAAMKELGGADLIVCTASSTAPSMNSSPASTSTDSSPSSASTPDR